MRALSCFGMGSFLGRERNFKLPFLKTRFFGMGSFLEGFFGGLCVRKVVKRVFYKLYIWLGGGREALKAIRIFTDSMSIIFLSNYFLKD